MNVQANGLHYKTDYLSNKDRERVAVITMVYNESYNLPSWVRHYTTQCPDCELYVVDHGSDIPVREQFNNINVLRIPRTDFDEKRRSDMISHLHSALLFEFDWVLHTDCDELVVSPNFDTLTEALKNEESDVEAVTAIGMNVWHDVDGNEPTFDRSQNILDQRKYATFEMYMCKPFASRKPIHWIPGFHTSNLKPCFGNGFFLFHTKYMDYNESNQRLTLTKNLNWSQQVLDKNWSRHQRIDESSLMTQFKAISALIANDQVSEFNFDQVPSKFVDGCVKDSKGNWRCDTPFEERLVEIPAYLLAKLP